MQYLSPPMPLQELSLNDHFYFDQEVSQNVFVPRTTVWEFLGPAHAGGFWIAQVDQTVAFGEKPKTDRPGEVLVRRIRYQ